MATLNDILAVPRFFDMTLLNKHANLERTVDTIEISETPDVSGYLPKHSLLLTTGMAFKDNPKELCELIHSLNALPSAGLAIKLGRFISELDPEVIAFADKLNFPIIQIPPTKTLGEVSHQLLSYIWDNHNESMHFALDVQRNFSSMMMKGASTDALVNHLSSLIKQPMLLINPFGDIDTISRRIKPEDIITQETLNQVVKDVHTYQINPTQLLSYTTIDRHNEPLVATFYPVGNSHCHAYVLVIFQSDQLPYPFSQLAIEQALSVLSFTTYKDNMIKQDKRNAKKDFFNKLIGHDSEVDHDVTHWIDYGKPFGIIQSPIYQVIIGHVSIPDTLDYHEKEIMQLTHEWFDSKIEGYFKNAIFIPNGDQTQLVILLQHKTTQITEQLEALHNELLENLNVTVTFGVGTTIKELSLARFSLNAAKKALEEYDPQQADFIYYYQNRGISSLISEVSEDDIHYFCTTTLGPLAYPTSESNRELRQTLKVYLDNQCRITETADELFIHRNTVKYRINKCDTLFGQSIEEPLISLQLRLALLLSSDKNRYLTN